MTYVALLRGINVGGHRKVEMAKLAQTFERLGFSNIKTFIASGNVIFRTNSTSHAVLTKKIEGAIEKDFGFNVPVLLRNTDEIAAIVKAIPTDWVTDKAMRCDVLFLWSNADSPDILKQIPYNPQVEDLRYFPGVVVNRIDRVNTTKGRMIKIIGTDTYKKITIRNANSVRKIYDLMLAAEKAS